MLQFIKNFARTKIRQLIIQGDVDLEAWRGGAITPAQIYKFYASSSRLTDPYKQIPSVYSSVHFFSEVMSSVPLQVFEGTYNSEDGKRAAADNNKWAKLFDNMHPELTSEEMMSLWVQHMLLNGCALWLCLDSAGKPCEPKDAKEFWPEPPARAKFVIDKNSMLIREWKITGIDNITRKYPAETVLFWRETDPGDIHGVTSRIEAIGLGSETEFEGKKANKSLLRTSMGMGGMFSSPDWKFSKQRKEAEQALKDQRSAQNGFDALFLPGNVNWTKPDMNLRNMQHKELLEYLAGENRTSVGVPSPLLSPSADVPFASLFAMLQYFCHFRVKPLMRKFESRLWKDLFRKVEGGKMWVAFDTTGIPAFMEDYKSLGEAGVKLKELGVSVTDIKTLLRIRIPDRDYHNTPIVNSSMVPITAVMEGKTIPSAPQASSAPGSQNQPSAATNPDTARVNPDQSPTKSVKKTVTIAWDWAPFDSIVTDAKSSMETYFNDQRVDCEKRFFNVTGGRKSRATATVMTRALTADEIEAILFAEEEWNKRLINNMSPTWRAAFGVSEKILKEKLGSLDLWRDKSAGELERIEQAAADRIVGINEDTRARLKASLVEGSQNNETIAQLQSRVNAIFNNSKSARSLAIARTEMGGAASEARFAIVSAEGAEEKEWMTAGDENVSHGEVTGNTQNRNHAALNGEIRKIDERYSNGLMMPLEVTADAREAVNCRCTERYIFKNKQ